VVSAVETVDLVGERYRHVSKAAVRGPLLALGDAVLKWYDVAPARSPVPPETRALSRRVLREATDAGTLELGPGLGFAILHRCGESFYFLLLATWRNDNELWETVWAKDGDGQSGFEPWPSEGTHRPTFCVWELGVVCHEQRAWSRYLRSRRDEASRQAYLRSSYEGAV
jgi:hypothetical protein